MARSEVFEKDWFKLEQEIIYQEKALNTGVFSSGYFYDFYQEKEALSAEQFVLNSELKDCVKDTIILKTNNGFTELYRLTVVLDLDKVGEDYKK